MQPRYRSNGFRPGCGYWNDNGGLSFGRGHRAPQPIRDADIFMEAGRLATEYLVSKGLIDPESLPVNGRNHEFMGPEREQHFSDAGYVRRSYMDPRISRIRGRRRYDPYGRGYGSEWWSREDGLRGPWMAMGSSSRRYPDIMEDGDDDFVPGYARVHLGRFDARFGSEEEQSKSEVTGESVTEVDAREMVDDTGSKASSSSIRKDSLAAEDEVEGSKAADDATVLNSGDEVKSDASCDSKRNLQEEDVDMQPADGEVNNKMEVVELGASDVIEGEEAIKGFLCDAHTNESNDSKCQEADLSSNLLKQSMEEPKEPQYESRECLPGFGSFITPEEVSNEGGFVQHIDDKMEGIETQRDISPQRLSQETEHRLQDFGKQSSPDTWKLSTDEKMVEGIDQQKRVDANVDILPKAESDFHVKPEEERHHVTTSFNLCLMGTPETTEISDKNHGPILKNGKELPMDVGLSIGNNIIGTDDYNGISVDGKVIPVINLEDVSSMEDNACHLSKLKNSTACSSLDNFLNQTANPDFDGMHDDYSHALPEFLGNDISGCSSVPGDLNDLQTDTSLRDTQGVQGGDDSIDVSLEEIPIGLMGVWDQPPEDYGNGKFF